MFSWRIPKAAPLALVQPGQNWMMRGNQVNNRNIIFPNQYTFDEYCRLHEWKIGRLLTWDITPDITQSNYPSVSVITGWLDDYTDLEYNNKGNPKWMRVATIYEHDKAHRHMRYDAVDEFRVLTPREIDWVKNNVQLATRLKDLSEETHTQLLL